MVSLTNGSELSPVNVFSSVARALGGSGARSGGSGGGADAATTGSGGGAGACSTAAAGGGPDQSSGLTASGMSLVRPSAADVPAGTPRSSAADSAALPAGNFAFGNFAGVTCGGGAV